MNLVLSEKMSLFNLNESEKFRAEDQSETLWRKESLYRGDKEAYESTQCNYLSFT
jgi:hypothetical protein